MQNNIKYSKKYFIRKNFMDRHKDILQIYKEETLFLISDTL